MELQQKACDHLYNHKKGSHASKPESKTETQRRSLQFAGMKMQYQTVPGFTVLFVIGNLVQIADGLFHRHAVILFEQVWFPVPEEHYIKREVKDI